MKDLISVIIPVYKVEKWLPKCIKSVMNQTYQSLEIILIDDGSPDKSPQICDKFARLDSRIKVIHKQNGGVSESRNYGLNIATGKYVCFVDSDDWLPLNAIENLYYKIKSEHADLCNGTIKCIYPVRNAKLKEVVEMSVDKANIEKYIEFLVQLDKGPWGKLYRLDIIKKEKIKFPEEIKSGEDTIFLMKYLQVTEKVTSIVNEVYVYNRLVAESATKKTYENFHIWMRECVVEYSKIYPKIEVGESFSRSMNSFAVRYFDIACRHFLQLGNINDKEKVMQYLQETHTLFEKYMCDIIDEEYFQAKEIFEFYTPFLEQGNYEGLYNALFQRILKRRDGILTRLLRGFIAKCKEIQILYFK